jgi:hypothetical protein
MDEMRKSTEHLLCQILDVRDIVICVVICLASTGSMKVYGQYVPTPMPTSTIKPREISDTVSLFTGERFSTRAEMAFR